MCSDSPVDDPVSVDPSPPLSIAAMMGRLKRIAFVSGSELNKHKYIHESLYKNCNTMTQPETAEDKEFIFITNLWMRHCLHIMDKQRGWFFKLSTAKKLLAGWDQLCQATKPSCGEVL